MYCHSLMLEVQNQGAEGRANDKNYVKPTMEKRKLDLTKHRINILSVLRPHIEPHKHNMLHPLQANKF